MKKKLAAIGAAATLGVLAFAGAAQATVPSCSTSGTNSAPAYLAFTTVGIANFVGGDTAFKQNGWSLDSCLTDSSTESAHVVLHQVGANFNGYGNPETVKVEANVYYGVFSDEGCNGGAVRSLNDGYLDTFHDHYNSGDHAANGIATSC